MSKNGRIGASARMVPIQLRQAVGRGPGMEVSKNGCMAIPSSTHHHTQDVYTRDHIMEHHTRGHQTLSQLNNPTIPDSR